MMIITNLENDAFSDELGRLILNDNTVKTKLFQEIVSTAKSTAFAIFTLISNIYVHRTEKPTIVFT